ncbi:MAG: PP2C family protein-serine/threonine phosphatase [Bacteriovoracia bacterium]
MVLSMTALVKNPTGDGQPSWVAELQRALARFPGFESVISFQADQPGQVIFVDAKLPDLADVLARLDRRGRAVFLVVGDVETVPAEWVAGQVDDVLVYPFRDLEVLGKLKHFQRILMWDEVEQINRSFTDLVESLRGDLQLAERLQKKKFPTRFANLKGFSVKSRYLAGGRSGGDYFDLSEASPGGPLSFVLTDSSTYGLSSAVLSVLMSTAVKLGAGENRSCAETVRRIHEHLAATLGPKDQLSLAYGTIQRKDLSLSLLCLGSVGVFHSANGTAFTRVPAQAAALSQTNVFKVTEDYRVNLKPLDRIVLFSDGFIEGVGGEQKALGMLNTFRKKESTELLNEFLFKIKSGLESSDDLPEQDCTGVVLDVESNVLSLARG